MIRLYYGAGVHVLRVRPDASDLPRVLRWLAAHGDAAQALLYLLWRCPTYYVTRRRRGGCCTYYDYLPHDTLRRSAWRRRGARARVR